MNQTIMAVVLSIFSTALIAQASVSQKPGYEAAYWKTFLIDHPETISIAAAPIAAQSRSELTAVRTARRSLTEKQLQAIHYWNAGAPSYRWNQIGPKLIPYDRFDVVGRTPTAWMNMAIYDATILAWKEKLRYKRKRPAALDPSLVTVVDPPLTYAYPCEHSVTAAAAGHVLAYFFPEKGDSILQLARAASQSRVNAGVQFPSDAEAGWDLGEQVARQVIEKARNDGSTNVWKGTLNKDPAMWTGSFALGINFPLYTTLVLDSARQFRPLPPPNFEKDMEELRKFRQTFKSRSLAYYWANNGGFDFWSEVAALKMFEYRMMEDAPAVARIYAVLHTAYHDVVIAMMDAKYAYWGIRPDQFDTTFKPLLATPPFPGYPSGHAAGAGTTSAVMEFFFPADAGYFRQLAQECADSRFYAGIHFRSDNETGLQMGRKIGNYIARKWMGNMGDRGDAPAGKAARAPRPDKGSD